MAGAVGTVARVGLLQVINHGLGALLGPVCSGYDVFHVSNQVRVTPPGVRLTATIHDLTCRLMPELHTAANVRADASFARNIVGPADGLIAVSESSRQDAIRLLGVKPERIRTIHSGVSDAFFSARPAQGGRPYVLVLGTVEPRKNVDRLLDAWDGLPSDVRGAFELKVCGPRGWHSEATLERLARTGQYLGYVPEEELPALVAGAAVFAYPSLYEGFGFPLAEAMAAGVACLTSNVSSLPEVAGGAALLVDPLSVDEIRGGLLRLLTSPGLRAELSRAARVRAEHFRWERAARESIEFFEQVAAGQLGR